MIQWSGPPIEALRTLQKLTSMTSEAMSHRSSKTESYLPNTYDALSQIATEPLYHYEHDGLYNRKEVNGKTSEMQFILSVASARWGIRSQKMKL